ncbi:MAG: hypothetical protein QXQ87_09235 [Halobacteria archaeon]
MEHQKFMAKYPQGTKIWFRPNPKSQIIEGVVVGWETVREEKSGGQTTYHEVVLIRGADGGSYYRQEGKFSTTPVQDRQFSMQVFERVMDGAILFILLFLLSTILPVIGATIASLLGFWLGFQGKAPIMRMIRGVMVEYKKRTQERAAKQPMQPQGGAPQIDGHRRGH